MATKALASKTGQVKFLQKGDPGKRGQLPYPAGEYDMDTDYICTDLIAPYVLYDGIYYVMNRITTWIGHGVPSNINDPKKDYAVNGKNATWIPFENYKAVYVEILMANFAKLASAVFHGNYMFSQQGVDADGNPTNDYRNFGTADFTPNLMFDFLTGSFKGKEVEIQGDITANTMFLKVCTNAAGEEPNGAIHIQIGAAALGPLPELEPGTCRVLKLLVPLMTRVPMDISLTTVSDNVLIAPDAQVLLAVRTYTIGNAYGVYELNGFHELGSSTTYWCLSKHGYL